MEKKIIIDVVKEIEISGQESYGFNYSIADDVEEIDLGCFNVYDSGIIFGELNTELLLYKKELVEKAKNIIFENGLKQISKKETVEEVYDKYDDINVPAYDSLDCFKYAKRFIEKKKLDVRVVDKSDLLAEYSELDNEYVYKKK